jgi:hypothetical protein
MQLWYRKLHEEKNERSITISENVQNGEVGSLTMSFVNDFKYGGIQ